MNESYQIIESYDLIGVPFEWGGRDPEISLDCYGLVKFINSKRGIAIPDYHSPSDKILVNQVIQEKMKLWHPTDERKEGLVVVFRAGKYLHCGYVLGDGRFAHTWEMSGGVTIEYLSDWEGRMLGVYEYVG
ncbi:NlpC/P60 family protein [Vibrio owensii]|uniref:NlpC/P60 family protein n=1 Tax=Vibrio owensii TaxID=696485 RepID=UPI0033983E92